MAAGRTWGERMTCNNGFSRTTRNVTLDVRALAEQRLLAGICADPTITIRFGVDATWFTDPAHRTVFLILSRYHREHPEETDLNPDRLVMFALTDTVLAGRVHREGDQAPVDSVTEGMVRNLTEEGWHWKSYADQLADTIRAGLAERMAAEETADLLRDEPDPQRQAEGLERIAAKIRELTESGNAHRQKGSEQAGKQTFVDVDALYREFPTSVFPESVRRFIRSGARSIGCDEAMIAAPLLVVCASCIGMSRKVMMKPGWSEPPILWLLVIAASGDHKSPALELVYRAIRDKQRKAVRKWEKEHEHWAECLVPQYESDLKEHRKARGTGGPPPEKPEEPVCPRFIIDDATVEALAPILQANPRGVMAALDEGANWFSALERYKTSSDAGKWLEFHGGRSVIVDRKTGDRKTLYIPHAAVSICAGIQPLIYRKLCRTAENDASGMSARFLIVQAPRNVKQWTDTGVDEVTEQRFASVVDRLLTLEMQLVDDDPDPRPVICRLTPEARSLFIEFYNSHAKEQADLSDELSSAWSKLEAYAARLALTVHYIRWADGEVSERDRETVDAVSMASGIELVGWFANEARRVHSVTVETPEEREQRELLEWVRRQGGSTSPREMTRKLWRYRGKTDEARSALSRMVKNGSGVWEQMNTEGRTSEAFTLSDSMAHRHRHNPDFQVVFGPSVDAHSRNPAGEGFTDPGVDRLATDLEGWA